MEIPMEFTMEYLEEAILQTLPAEKASARIRMTVFRKEGGLYLPEDNNISYIIESASLAEPAYQLSTASYEITLFRDYTITAHLLSNVKTNNKILNVVGSIYARENGYDNCLLLNQDKQVVEALNGNLFLVKDNLVKTPPLTDGCINGIMRKQILTQVRAMDSLRLEEVSVSPFELQNADEMFLTNVIVGIQPVSTYRKAQFGSGIAANILEKVNREAGLV
jgi:branched-chain amino acid aminotransferase